MSKKEKVKGDSPAAGKTTSRDLQASLTRLQEKYGVEMIGIGNAPKIEWIKTGLYPFDYLTGGGIPRGRWTQIYGPKSSGKTTLCHYLESIVQEMGEDVVHIDAEHAMDPQYAESLGVDVDNLIFSRPKSQEQVMSTIMEFAGKVGLIVVDSIVAVGGDKELRAIEKDGIEKDSMMVIPQKLSQFFRVVNPQIAKTKTAIILINQTRTNIGGYVAFDDFSGGNALKHYNSISLMIRPGPRDEAPKSEDGKTALGQNAVMKVDKNKVGGQPQGATASFDLYFEAPHIRPQDELIKSALSKGVVQKDGRTYSFNGKKIAVGEDAAWKAIKEDQTLQGEIVKALEPATA